MKLKLEILVLIIVGLELSESLFTSGMYSKVKLKFIYGFGVNDQSQYSEQNVTQLLHHQRFNKVRPTVLYISGWTHSPEASLTQQLIRAYLKRGDYNVLVLDWGDYSVGMYSAVMIRISNISRKFGRVLLKLFDKGLNTKSFHCVGHSFGAHSCGIIGRELFQASKRKYKLGRITGLDPAGPGFYPFPTYEKPLNRDDGVFVDAIHSDVFFIGTKSPVGHVDFYPNYDMVQPACPAFRMDSFYNFVNSMCSHLNAIRYWVDTLNPRYGRIFVSYQCSSWDDFDKKQCRRNPINYMGIEATPRVQGKFFIRLNSKKFYDGKELYNWLLRRIEDRANNLISFKFR